MSSEGYSSDLEVLSKMMASSELTECVDSKFTSPEDSPEHSVAPSEVGAGKEVFDVKLNAQMVNGKSDGSIDAVLEGSGHHCSTISPEDASNDPMLASALMSPLQAPLNIEALFAPSREETDSTPLMGLESPDELFEMTTSRVGDKERQVHYGEEDEQGRGWRYEVGWESFRTRIAVLDSPQMVGRLEPELKEIERLIMRTSPNGVKIVIEWAAAVILATRK
ncbi:hypothetical protein LTR48_001802 [Friedmanniomyces endolithicus]|uniref:Uncharacterized protein n=1 Tax=Rachicladosporium monterosium TaxID=1507873 RepID=A0ABR0LE10_9PEZI|nr:hypothetical protein LTR48_001802 [Friedmanniomyces endolithicus]KAK5146839.1 hypothetical protein LTR32_001632 [Rachicladosporium monterosium]